MGIAGFGAVKLSRAGFTTFGAADGLSLGQRNDPDQGAFGLALLGTDDATWSLYCLDGETLHPVKPLGACPRLRSWGWNQVLIEDREGDWWFALGEGVFRYPRVHACSDLARTKTEGCLQHAERTTGRRRAETLRGCAR